MRKQLRLMAVWCVFAGISAANATDYVQAVAACHYVQQIVQPVVVAQPVVEYVQQVVAQPVAVQRVVQQRVVQRVQVQKVQQKVVQKAVVQPVVQRQKIVQKIRTR